MSQTFTNGGYTVTVNDDRSINVKPGDWISKYSAAIYGDPQANWDRFMRKQGNTFEPLEDPNLIRVGEKIYHPDPLPGEVGVTPPPGSVIRRPEKRQVDQHRMEEWLNWLGRIVTPVTEWSFMGSGGAELTGSVFAGHYVTIGAKRTRDTDITWYHGVGAGLSFGPESIAGSFVMSTTQFPSDGVIGKLPSAGQSLSKDEICGAYVVADFGIGFAAGVSASLFMFGFNLPPGYVVRNFIRFLSGDDYLPLHNMLPMGLVLMGGLHAGTPNVGVSFKAGWMHRLECLPGI